MIEYWIRSNVDRPIFKEKTLTIKESLKSNESSIIENHENESDKQMDLDEFRTLIHIIEACFALSFMRLTFEIVFHKFNNNL